MCCYNKLYGGCPYNEGDDISAYVTLCDSNKKLYGGYRYNDEVSVSLSDSGVIVSTQNCVQRTV